MPHGHHRSDVRNLRLHQAALGKLAREPQLQSACLQLVQRWLQDPALAASRIYLERWRALLRDASHDELAAQILDFEAGQALRQSSPLGPALTPQERWSILREVDRELDRELGRELDRDDPRP